MQGNPWERLRGGPLGDAQEERVEDASRQPGQLRPRDQGSFRFLLYETHLEGVSKKWAFRHACCGSVETDPIRIHEDAGSIPGLAQWIKNPALLWLWCRPVATAPIRPLAWELPYATDAALKTHTQNNDNRYDIKKRQLRK